MLTKKITYTNYNDVEVTDTLYFNLTKSEILSMELETEGGLREKLVRIGESKNSAQILKVFKDIIMLSYGEKSDDGKYLRKGENHELAKAFMETPAYDVLVMDILSDETGKKFTEFVLHVVPKEVLEEVDKRGGIDKVLEDTNLIEQK